MPLIPPEHSRSNSRRDNMQPKLCDLLPGKTLHIKSSALQQIQGLWHSRPESGVLPEQGIKDIRTLCTSQDIQTCMFAMPPQWSSLLYVNVRNLHLRAFLQKASNPAIEKTVKGWSGHTGWMHVPVTQSIRLNEATAQWWCLTRSKGNCLGSPNRNSVNY